MEYKSFEVDHDIYEEIEVNFKDRMYKDVQAIENTEADNVRSTKVIIDGKVYINHGDKVFTLQGQEVK